MATADEYVIPAAHGLDQAPPADERQIIWVDLEFVDDRRTESGVTKRVCQHCGDIVDLLEPHPHAVLWGATAEASSIDRIMYKPDFCDRECWLEWMRAAENEEES